MKNISPKNFLFVPAVFFLGLISYNFFHDLSFSDTAWPLGKGDKIKIAASSTIDQKFTANRDGLSGAEILFGNANLDGGADLTLKVYDESCSNILRTSSYFAPAIASDETEIFSFERINDSNNKIYCLNLSFQPKKNNRTGSIFIVPNTRLENISLSINNQDYSGKSLSMQPIYRNSNLWQDLGELNQRISQYKPWFLKHYFLSFIAFGFLIFSILLMVILILTSSSSPTKKQS